ncbi:SMI1/KNR4 family protein [Burkholderia ubonensis]|uniref:SMI1/KNR4 family protein n=1 Tax=Burkholderia ubonensis TaxID=101571 RepID=UPI000A519FA3|nr:SMI1/KNR4 family protein [Burkholderia ubonensis]
MMSDDDWVDGLVKFISRFDEEFCRAIEAANEVEIDALEGAMRVDLPEVYRTYLRHMGRSDGGLFNGLRADSRINKVAEYCVDLQSEFNDMTFERCIPFAVGDVYEGLGLQVERDRENPPVVMLEDGRAGEYIAHSLPSFAYQRAFLYERASLGVTAYWENFRRGVGIPDVRSISAEIGFVEEWFSDDQLYCARGSSLLLLAYMGAPGRGLSIGVSGRDEKTVFEKGNVILEIMCAGNFRRLTKEPTLSEVRAHGGAKMKVLREAD